MKFKNYTIYIGILLILGCSPQYGIQSFETKSIEVKATADSISLAIIEPYKLGIEKEMNEVLCISATEMTKGNPESLLGNFVTDLCLNYTDADLCIMNRGGLRTTINKGEVTRGKIFELMPFENELVVLELNKNEYLELLNYITKRGGEPFSGIKITIDEKNNLLSNSWPVNFEKGEKVKVITSDYLANGGDKMKFFKGKEQLKVGIKLRDAIIDHCSKLDTIYSKLDGRIKIINNEE